MFFFNGYVTYYIAVVYTKLYYANPWIIKIYYAVIRHVCKYLRIIMLSYTLSSVDEQLEEKNLGSLRLNAEAFLFRFRCVFRQNELLLLIFRMNNWYFKAELLCH